MDDFEMPVFEGRDGERWIWDKECGSCRQTKPLDRFSKNEGGKYGRHSKCKECVREYGRRLRNEKPETEREYQRRHYEKNRDTKLTKNSIWKKENPLKLREYRAKRRAAMGNGHVDYEYIIERDQATCYLCEDSVDLLIAWPDPESKSFDHVVALIKGGPHSNENVRLTHLRCNLSKHDREIEL